MDGEYIEKIKAEVDITNMVVDIEDEWYTFNNKEKSI
jgi:hypothetical protein